MNNQLISTIQYQNETENNSEIKFIIFCNINNPPLIAKYMPQYETEFVDKTSTIYEYIYKNYDNLMKKYYFFISENDFTNEMRKSFLEILENNIEYLCFNPTCLFISKKIIMKKLKMEYLTIINLQSNFFLQKTNDKSKNKINENEILSIDNGNNQIQNNMFLNYENDKFVYNNSCEINIPKLIFVVPYRDREEQLKFYLDHMKNKLMFGRNDYEILIIHQNDQRNFNRGALKNIGFLFLRQKYPNEYKNITIVFNDVDIMPINANFIHYETSHGIIKHFYGFSNTLGGIFSITGSDFEKIGGFPNFWTWGYEDNAIQLRTLKKGLFIDRSQFYPIFDKNFILLHDGKERKINTQEVERYVNNTNEGFNDIKYIVWNDNDFEEKNIINIVYFQTLTLPPNPKNTIPYTPQNALKYINKFQNQKRKQNNPHRMMLFNSKK